MDFGDVVKAMKEDPSRRFAKKSWDNSVLKNVINQMKPYIQLMNEGDESHKCHDVIFIIYTAPNGREIRTTFPITQNDVLEDDWMEV